MIACHSRDEADERDARNQLMRMFIDVQMAEERTDAIEKREMIERTRYMRYPRFSTFLFIYGFIMKKEKKMKGDTWTLYISRVLKPKSYQSTMRVKDEER